MAQNHPFEQGNKRAAFGAAAFFLAKNDVRLLPREDDGYADMMQGLISGELTRDDAAVYLAQNSIEMQRDQEKTAPVQDQALEDHKARIRERLAQDRAKSRDGFERD